MARTGSRAEGGSLRMEKMLADIDFAIQRQYEDVKQQKKVCAGIEDIYRQVRFQYPELAEHIKRRMLDIAKEKGDLP